MMKPCPHCKRARPAIRDLAGKIIILPHMADGSERKPGLTCGAKR